MWTFKFSIRGHLTVFLRLQLFTFLLLNPPSLHFLLYALLILEFCLHFKIDWEKWYFNSSLLIVVPLKTSCLVQGGLSADCWSLVVLSKGSVIVFSLLYAFLCNPWWSLVLATASFIGTTFCRNPSRSYINQLIKTKRKIPQIIKMIKKLLPQACVLSPCCFESISHSSSLLPDPSKVFWELEEKGYVIHTSDFSIVWIRQ